MIRTTAGAVFALALVACQRVDAAPPASWLEFAWRERIELLVVVCIVALLLLERRSPGAKP